MAEKEILYVDFYQTTMQKFLMELSVGHKWKPFYPWYLSSMLKEIIGDSDAEISITSSRFRNMYSDGRYDVVHQWEVKGFLLSELPEKNVKHVEEGFIIELCA